MDPAAARWDYYSATIWERSSSDVIAALRPALPQITRIEHEKATQPGYEWQERGVDRFDKTVLLVFGGGHNGYPHVRATGERAEAVVPVLRHAYPAHSVSRCDSAIDLRGEGCFDHLVDEGLEVVRDFGVKWDVRGDWREPSEREPSGRTFYIGSRQSTSFVRVYEKGLKELAGYLVVPGVEPPSPHWVRVEVELKPQTREARRRAARLDKFAVWGCSAASRDMLRRVSSLDVERIFMREHRESDARRTIRYVAAQYGNAFLELCDELGEAGALEFLLTAIEDAKRVRNVA